MYTGIDHEKIFFNFFLKKPQYLKSVSPGFFSNRDLDQVAKLSKNFYIKFGESPSKEQMKALVKDDPNEISDDIVSSVYNVNINEYDQDWLKRTSESWIKWKHFDKQLIKTIEYVKTQDVSPDNVQDIVTRAIGMISTEGSINFDSDVGLDFFNPEHHIQRKSKKLETGWTFVDNVSGGGYDPKSLVVYAGEQNVGKSIWLANDAANFVRMGHNVVFITAEMSAQKVLKRIGANLLDIPMMEYDEKSGNRDFIKRKLERISRGLLPPGKLFVKEFPTSQGTVLDIESYIKELEESQDHKVNVVIVDYINILANYRNPNTENTYMKIKQIAEDLRALAVKREMLIISATQINRGAWDSTEIKMENIAESAGLAHTVDVMYALIQDSMMHANKEYWLKVLKIRDGQGKGSRCRFNINYDYMRLTETDDITN
jgi:KaiC/GvpD/RAD55 family RecA-like ATPase